MRMAALAFVSIAAGALVTWLTMAGRVDPSAVGLCRGPWCEARQGRAHDVARRLGDHPAGGDDGARDEDARRKARGDDSQTVTDTPPPHPPPAAPCMETPRPPKRLGGDEAYRAMFAALRTLYASGEFVIGACVAHVEVNEAGGVDAVRVVRPREWDPRVATRIVRALQADRYRAASACGRPVPFRLTVSFVHCPVRAARY